jgi:hypothetical protein
VATLLVALLGGLAIAAPAQAGPPQREGYLAITAYGDKFPGWFWIDEMEGIIGCPQCLHWFDFYKSQELRVEQEAVFTGGVIAGLDLLGQARAATNPRLQEALRAEALGQFSAAARELGSTTLRAGPVGYYDPDRDATVATGSSWLAAANQDVVDGITLLQRSFEGPTPDPWIVAAVAQFDEAFEEIATKQAIGA